MGLVQTLFLPITLESIAQAVQSDSVCKKLKIADVEIDDVRCQYAQTYALPLVLFDNLILPRWTIESASTRARWPFQRRHSYDGAKFASLLKHRPVMPSHGYVVTNCQKLFPICVPDSH